MNREATLGDILAEALNNGKVKTMFYQVTIKSEPAPFDGVRHNKINDIKALREMTRMPDNPNGVPGIAMGLTAAKAAIEATYYSRDNSAVIRMTPEQYAAFEYRRTVGISDIRYEWWMDSVKAVFPEETPNFFTY